MQKPETELVAACLEFLLVSGIPAWRNNSGAARFGKSFVRYGYPGSPDILAALPPHGRLLCVECKVGRNKPSPDQVRFLSAMRDAGAMALVVYDLDELVKVIEMERRTE